MYHQFEYRITARCDPIYKEQTSEGETKKESGEASAQHAAQQRRIRRRGPFMPIDARVHARIPTLAAASAILVIRTLVVARN